MSKMIPQETVDGLRQFTNISVDTYGIDCTLYIPTNLDTIEQNDVYIKPSDYQYINYTTKVFLEWAPNQARLRKLGIYTEDELPLIAWFSNVIKNDDGSETEVDIIIGSYFVVNPQFIPDNVDAEEFDIVDVLIRGMHDKVALKTYRCAPRRRRIES